MFRVGILTVCCTACGFSIAPAGTPDDAVPDTLIDANIDMAIDVAPCTPVEVVAGGERTCARSVDGTVRCWGRGNNGELGIGLPTMKCNVGGSNYFCSTTPVVVQLPPATGLGLGNLHTCATTTGGTYCWGYNLHGAFGDGTFGAASGQLDPRLIAQRAGATSISGGTYHTCSLAGGMVACSGQNVAGEVGNGTQVARPTSTVVMPGAASVATGAYTTCAVTLQGIPQCWGSNAKRQIDSTGQNKLVPTMLGGMTDVVQAAVGRDHVCILFGDGTAKCAGSNLLGQLGTGTAGPDYNGPLSVAVPSVAEISAEQNHTCVRDQAGEVRCFGEGYGVTPTNIPLPAAAQSITSGSSHDCALTTTGEVYCWGRQDFGQLGNQVSSATPQAQAQRVAICQ